MSEEGDTDQNAVIRGIIESMVSGEISPKGVSADNVAQLLAAAIAQAGQNMLSVQGVTQTQQDISASIQAQAQGGESVNFDVNSFGTEKTNTPEHEQLDTSGSLEALTPDKPRLLCVKLPIELRKRIIALRKEGKKCREIAKELKVSVSGVRKVWERFLDTGMVHDRKPHSGRPRKYPVPSSFEVQYTTEEVVNSDSPHIEYVTISESDPGESVPISTATTTLSDDVFVEGPLDMPGATVEIVETDPHPVSTPQEKKSKKGPPVYREQLLLRLIEGCPLSTVREDAARTSSPHVTNLSSITTRSLYMESALGYPFGQIPPPRTFEADLEQAKVILTDPVNPLSKDLLATLGYSTKVYFNMCCKPSPLFDQDKLTSDLPFSLGPGHMTETTQSVLQLLVNLCKDPVAGLSRIPPGDGPVIAASSPDSRYMTVRFSVPKQLSHYWKMIYQCASDFQCCENFLSASPPSAPCLLCHPFQKLAKQLEIKEPSGDEIWTPTTSRGRTSRSQPSSSTQLSSPLVTSDSDQPVVVQEEVKKTGRKRGRQKKTQACEDQLVIDGQFEVPTSIESSGEAVPEFQPPSSESISTAGSDAVEVALATPQVSLTEESTYSDSNLQAPVDLQQSSNPVEGPITHTQEENVIEVVQGELATPEHGDSPPQDESSSEGPALRRSQRKRTQTSQKVDISPYLSRPRRESKSRNSSLASQPEGMRPVGSSTEQDNLDPFRWSVEDVVEFVASIPRCKYSATFREHEVDGESLMSLDPEMMVKLMGIKTGPALKIHRKITELKDMSKQAK